MGAPKLARQEANPRLPRGKRGVLSSVDGPGGCERLRLTEPRWQKKHLEVQGKDIAQVHCTGALLEGNPDSSWHFPKVRPRCCVAEDHRGWACPVASGLSPDPPEVPSHLITRLTMYSLFTLFPFFFL